MASYISTKYNKEPIDHGFDNWYKKTYGKLSYPPTKNSRYYELRKAWKASKEFYKNA